MSLGDASSNRGSLKVSGAGSTVTVSQVLKVAPLLANAKVEVIDHAVLTVGHALIGSQFLSPLSDASVVVRDATWQINGNLTVAGGVGRFGPDIGKSSRQQYGHGGRRPASRLGACDCQRRWPCRSFRFGTSNRAWWVFRSRLDSWHLGKGRWRHDQQPSRRLLGIAARPSLWRIW